MPCIGFETVPTIAGCITQFKATSVRDHKQEKPVLTPNGNVLMAWSLKVPCSCSASDGGRDAEMTGCSHSSPTSSASSLDRESEGSSSNAAVPNVERVGYTTHYMQSPSSCCVTSNRITKRLVRQDKSWSQVCGIAGMHAFDGLHARYSSSVEAMDRS